MEADLTSFSLFEYPLFLQERLLEVMVGLNVRTAHLQTALAGLSFLQSHNQDGLLFDLNFAYYEKRQEQ